MTEKEISLKELDKLEEPITTTIVFSKEKGFGVNFDKNPVRSPALFGGRKG